MDGSIQLDVETLLVEDCRKGGRLLEDFNHTSTCGKGCFSYEAVWIMAAGWRLFRVFVYKGLRDCEHAKVKSGERII